MTAPPMIPLSPAYSPGHRRSGGFAKEPGKLSPECGDRFIRWAELEGRGDKRDAVGGAGEFMVHRWNRAPERSKWIRAPGDRSAAPVAVRTRRFKERRHL